jgi:hypothetical protein
LINTFGGWWRPKPFSGKTLEFWVGVFDPTAPTNFIDFKSLAEAFDTNKAFDTN